MAVKKIYDKLQLVFRQHTTGLASAILLCILIGSSCTRTNQGNAIISGGISGARGEKLVLLEMEPKAMRSLDSVVVDSTGLFRFTLRPQEKGFYLLRAGSGKVMVLLLGQGDTITLAGEFTGFPDQVTLQGPPDAVLLQGFFDFTRVRERQVDSLETILAEHQDSADYYPLTLALDTVFKAIWMGQRDDELRFIREHPNSLASLVALNYAFGMSPVLSPDEDQESYLLLDSTLMQLYPANKHVQYHHQRVQEYKRQQEVKSLRK